MVGIIDCPCCGGSEVEGELVSESHAYGHDYESHDMRCGECGAEWTLHYDDGEWWVQGDDDCEERS